MVSITVTEVEEVFGENDPNVPDKQALVTIAENLTDQVFGGRVTTNAEVEGSEEDFTKYLAAFLWNQTAGRSLNEEFQTGNADVVSRTKSEPRSALAGDPYGEVCLLYLRDRQSIGIIKMP